MTYMLSNIGGRIENQDFYGYRQTKFGELLVVCDGMGGHKSGIYAATVNLIEKINTIGITNGGNHDNLTASLVEMDIDSK